MFISGKYYNDGNFTYVFTSDTIYTISNNGEWGCIKIDGVAFCGQRLTKAVYNELKSRCNKYGTFEL